MIFIFILSIENRPPPVLDSQACSYCGEGGGFLGPSFFQSTRYR